MPLFAFQTELELLKHYNLYVGRAGKVIPYYFDIQVSIQQRYHLVSQILNPCN